MHFAMFLSADETVFKYATAVNRFLPDAAVTAADAGLSAGGMPIPLSLAEIMSLTLLSLRLLLLYIMRPGY